MPGAAHAGSMLTTIHPGTASPDEIRADLKAHPVPRALNLRMHEIET